MGSFRMIIVPIAKLQILGDELCHPFGVVLSMLIYPAIGGVHIHISPYLALKTVSLRNLQYSVEMLFDDERPVLQTVFFEILSPAQHKGFVHADVHASRRKALGKREKHMLYQLVGPFLPDKENIVDIFNLSVFGISENRAQMGQRLNARNQLDAAFRRIRVHFLQLRFGISAPQVSEIRFPVHLVRIFGV